MFFRPQSSTFAPVNQRTRRYVASWLLLAVFLPMLLLSSFHFHENHVSEQTECTECVAHHCHGHFTQADISFDACVLCQFLSLTLIAAVLTAAAIVFNVLWIRYAPQPCAVCNTSWGAVVTRGPPFV